MEEKLFNPPPASTPGKPSSKSQSKGKSTQGVNEVDYCRYPAREIQLQWLNYYLEAQKGTAATPREVERLYAQVNKFALASHFFWALWALIQNQYSTISFDFLRYAVIRFNQYFRVKPQVLALEMPK